MSSNNAEIDMIFPDLHRCSGPLLILACVPLLLASCRERTGGDNRAETYRQDALRSALLSPIQSLRTRIEVDFGRIVRKGKPFPWGGTGPSHYLFVPTGESLMDLATDKVNNLYVSTNENVWRVSKSGKIERMITSPLPEKVGQAPPHDGHIYGTGHVAANRDGSVLWLVGYHTLYVLRCGRPKLVVGDRWKLSFGGVKAGHGADAGFGEVHSATVMADDSLIFGSTFSVCRCDTEGNLQIIAGGPEYRHKDGAALEARFFGPIVVPHPEEGFWIVDWGWGGSLRLLRNGNVSTIIAGSYMRDERSTPNWELPKCGFSNPSCACLGPDGVLYVGEELSIVTVDSSGKMGQRAFIDSPDPQYHWTITAIAVDNDGNIFTAHNQACREFPRVPRR